MFKLKSFSYVLFSFKKNVLTNTEEHNEKDAVLGKV